MQAKRYTYRDFAVFVRINALTRNLELAFVKRGISFQIVKGLAFFERKENKDVLAYLAAVGESGRHAFVSSCRQRAGPRHRQSVAGTLAELRRVEPDHAHGSVWPNRQGPRNQGESARRPATFHRLMGELRGLVESPPEDVIRTLLDRSGYREMLLSNADNDDVDRLANVEELITSARQFVGEDGSRTIRDFLEQITLASDVDS